MALIWGKIKSINPKVALAVVLLAGITAAGLSVADTSANLSVNCTLPVHGNRTIVEFPDDWRLLSGQELGPLAVNIPAASYDIILQSYDNHLEKPPQVQPDESWFVRLLSGSNIVFDSNPIADLPDNQESIQQRVNSGVIVDSEITGLAVKHASDDTSNPNSIQPVCVAFDLVSVPPPPPLPHAPTCQISASPDRIQHGQKSTLFWNSLNATSAFINNGIGNVSVNGSRQVSPAFTTTYTGTFSGPGGSVNCSTTIEVETPVPAPTCSISVVPSAITVGQTATLIWNTQHATSANISSGVGTVPVNGSRDVSPSQTTTYVLNASGAGGSVSCSARLSVVHLQHPTCNIVVFPNRIERGHSANLNWTSQNATSAFLNQGIGSVSVNGSRQVSPSQTTVYILTVSGVGGQAQCQTTLQVDDTAKPPTCSIDVSPKSIQRGGSALLSWSSQNAVSASIDPILSHTPLNGSQKVSPAQSTSYLMTVTGSDGQKSTCGTTLTVSESQPPTCSMSIFPNRIERGQHANLNWTSQNATQAFINNGIGNVSVNGSRQVSPEFTTTYTGTFSNFEGSVNCSVQITVADTPPPAPPGKPSCQINVFPNVIQRGQRANLFWQSRSASTASLNNGIGNVPLLGDQSVLPSQSTLYVLSVRGNDQTATCSTFLIVEDTPPPLPPDVPSCQINIFPKTISRGHSANLNWTSQNATSAFLNQGIGSVSVNGSRQVSPEFTTTYTGTFSNFARSVNCSTTVTVQSTPLPPGTGQLFIQKQARNVSRGGSFADTVSASPGEQIRFEVRVTASGVGSQTGVFLRDVFPNQLNFIPGSLRIDGSTFSPEPLLFNSGIGLGTLSAGSSRTITFDGTVRDIITQTTMTNTAFARSSQTPERSDPAFVTVQVAGTQFGQSKSAFNLTKGVDATTVSAEPGDVITYNLTFRNTGSTTLNSVVVEDDIRDISELAVLVNQGGAREVTDGIIRWDPVNVQPGGQIIKTFQVKVKPAEQIPSSSDLLMVNFYGNEVRVPVKLVKGITPPRTGAGEWFAGILALLTTFGYWVYRRHSEFWKRLTGPIKEKLDI